MKSIPAILMMVIFFFPGCKGQEKKPEMVKDKEPYTAFEKKQSIAQNQDMPAMTNETNAGYIFRYAAKKATPGVVHIKSYFPVKERPSIPDFFRDFFGDDFWQRYSPNEQGTPQIQTGSASGVIISDDGYIVTNHHVVDNAERVEVVLHDQRSYKTKIIGTDAATDLALLKIEEKNLNFIRFGNSDSVEVGDMVLAVGNPFNLASTVTAGIISAKARNINILTDRSAVESYLQTDAAVNRGNSGGALVDISGKLIGINAAIATPTGVYAGYSFAIPVEIVKKVIDDLLKYGKVLRGYLGAVISDMNGEKAKMLGISNTTGVLVDSLLQNGAAMQAGIRKNDVITKIDNRQVETVTQLREIIARHHPGEKLQVTLLRNNSTMVIPVTLLPLTLQEETIQKEAGSEILKTLGITIEDLSAKEKEQLKITGGVKIAGIKDGIISQTTDIRENFIVRKVNGKIVNNASEFIRELKDKKGGVMLEGIYPGIPGVYYYAFGI
jgi:Do/DeqQ family serine protease